MKKVIALVLLSGCFTLKAFTQTKTTSEELLSDIITITDNKYKMDIYQLVTNADGTTMQVKAHSEAPQSVISRDQFVYYSTSIMSSTVDGYIPETSSVQDLDELIGNPDIEINLFMSKNGLQIETKGSSGTNRYTKKWDDY